MPASDGLSAPVFYPRHTRCQIAVEAGVDERSVLRYLRGEVLRSTTRYRIEKAIRALKLTTASTEQGQP